jgi:hypothetical protein
VLEKEAFFFAHGVAARNKRYNGQTMYLPSEARCADAVGETIDVAVEPFVYAVHWLLELTETS